MTKSNYLRMGIAALVLALAVPLALKIPANALSVDQNRVIPAREFATQQESYYRITINFNDANIGTAQKFGKLRQHAFITAVQCHVLTAFNAGTTNVVTVGTTLDNTSIIDASTSTKSIDETSATYQAITQAGSLGESVTSTADQDLYARYVQTGTAATAGKISCVIRFAPNDDM